MTTPHFEYLMINFGGGCNNRCIFCGTPPATPENTMRIREFAGLQELIEMADYLDITSSGEIPLHPDFAEIVELLHRLAKPFAFATNGSLLHKWVDIIRGAPTVDSFNNIRVSLNSLVPKTYERLCGDNLNQILQNIDLILGLNLPNFTLTTSYVITSHNWLEIPSIVDYALSRNIEARFFDLTPTLSYPPGLQVADTPENRKQLEEWKQYAKDKGANTFVFDFDMRTVTPVDLARLSERIKKCRDPYTLCGVGTDLEVSPCCYPGLTMGNLKDHSMDEIWNGEAYTDLRRCLAEGNPKYCMKCGK